MESYYERNKEKIKARSSKRYYDNKEKHSEYNKQYRLKNPEKFREFRKRWLVLNPAYDMYHNAKRRAKELGIPFDIKSKDIKIPSHCPILGIELGQENFRDSAASLDRIHPELGYTKDNIKVISLKANRIKAEGSAEVHERIADYIRNPDKY